MVVGEQAFDAVDAWGDWLHRRPLLLQVRHHFPPPPTFHTTNPKKNLYYIAFNL
jgi:hypothetical protein